MRGACRHSTFTLLIRLTCVLLKLYKEVLLEKNEKSLWVSLRFSLHAGMAGAAVCVECWQGLDCVVTQYLTRASDTTTFRTLFEQSVFLRMKEDAADVSSLLACASCLVSPTGKSEWKKVQLDDDVALSAEFGCKFVKFQLGNPAVEPAAKRPRVNAFDILLGSAQKLDALPAPRPVQNNKDELFNDILGHLKVSLHFGTIQTMPKHTSSSASTLVLGCLRFILFRNFQSLPNLEEPFVQSTSTYFSNLPTLRTSSSSVNFLEDEEDKGTYPQFSLL